MSTEICKLCNQESTPWFHINGHICQDCYQNSVYIDPNEDLRKALNDNDYCIECYYKAFHYVYSIVPKHAYREYNFESHIINEFKKYHRSHIASIS
jgi:hypothetical protein